jgi:transcriptional regulator with XRE-family HTH domain
VNKKARSLGWRLKKLPGGHDAYISPDSTQPIVVTSGTPSDRRAWHKIKADLRRSGFPDDRQKRRSESGNAGERPRVAVGAVEDAARGEEDHVGVPSTEATASGATTQSSSEPTPVDAESGTGASTFGAALRKARKDERLPVKELAKLVGAHPKAVADWEADLRGMVAAHYKALCDLMPALGEGPKPRIFSRRGKETSTAYPFDQAPPRGADADGAIERRPLSRALAVRILQTLRKLGRKTASQEEILELVELAQEAGYPPEETLKILRPVA